MDFGKAGQNPAFLFFSEKKSNSSDFLQNQDENLRNNFNV
jgi:hypothetical protein